MERIKNAWHVLRGYPLISGVGFVAPLALSEAHLRISRCYQK